MAMTSLRVKHETCLPVSQKHSSWEEGKEDGVNKRSA